MTITWVSENDYCAESLDGASMIKLLKQIVEGSVNCIDDAGLRTVVLLENSTVKAVIASPLDEWENFLDRLQREAYLFAAQPCA